MPDLDLAVLRAKAEEAKPIAWMGWFPGAGSVSSHHELTRHRSTMENWGSCVEITPLYDEATVLALLDRVEKAEAPQTLCMSCGTVSRDGTCHCTVDGTGTRNAVNRAEWHAKTIAKAEAEIAACRDLLARAGEALRPFITEWVPGQDPVKADLKVVWGHVERAHALAAEIKEAIGHE